MSAPVEAMSSTNLAASPQPTGPQRRLGVMRPWLRISMCIGALIVVALAIAGH
jgi:hypothetical protein